MDQKKGMFQDVDSSELRYRLKWAASVGHEPLRAAADITASTVHRQDWWDRLFSSSKHSFQQICNFKFIYKHFISYTICWWIYLFYNPEAPLYIPSLPPTPRTPPVAFLDPPPNQVPTRVLLPMVPGPYVWASVCAFSVSTIIDIRKKLITHYFPTPVTAAMFNFI